MALTPSIMLPLGTQMPSFSLPDTMSGNLYDSNTLTSKTGSVIMFICNHCPYVIHIQEEMVKIANEFLPKGIDFVAISSNDAVNYPADSPELMKENGNKLKFNFPYLYDESQETAKAFDAACTPDFYVFNQDQKCIYRGRMDGSTPGNSIPVTGKDLRDALEALLAGNKIPENEQMPSMGCNIKWK